MFRFGVFIITYKPSRKQIGFGDGTWEKYNAGAVQPKTIRETSRCATTSEVKCS